MTLLNPCLKAHILPIIYISLFFPLYLGLMSFAFDFQLLRKFFACQLHF